MSKILYGTEDVNIDVTQKVFETCQFKVNDKKIYIIPSGDQNRANLFTDPIYGTVKKIFVFCEAENETRKYVFDQTQTCFMESVDEETNTWSISYTLKDWKLFFDMINDPKEKLNLIHKNLKFEGMFEDEYPEQLISVMFIKPDAKVLELGSNIGRNTLTIATLLNSSTNLVTCETDPNAVEVLKRNRDMNDYKFEIVNAALSYRNLIQKGWDTIPSEIVLPGYTPVERTTFEDIENKYNITFDTLVVDCEGALYYILKDNSNILKNIKMIIMENDYHDINHKRFIDLVMVENLFNCIYSIPGGWGPCKNFFYQVWSK